MVARGCRPRTAPIAIDVGQIFDNVKEKLDARGITIFDDVTLPASAQEFVLFQSQTLADVQGIVDLLQTLAWVLPVVALVCFGAAIALSKRRRRTIERGALGVLVRGSRCNCCS